MKVNDLDFLLIINSFFLQVKNKNKKMNQSKVKAIDAAEKQSLLAVLQFLKKKNLKVIVYLMLCMFCVFTQISNILKFIKTSFMCCFYSFPRAMQ